MNNEERMLKAIPAHGATAKEIAERSGIDRKIATAALTGMVESGVVIRTDEPPGVPVFSRAAEPAVQGAKANGKARKKTKPFTPNAIAGAYVHRGNLVIKLRRVAHAKSVTLSLESVEALMRFSQSVQATDDDLMEHSRMGVAK